MSIHPSGHPANVYWALGVGDKAQGLQRWHCVVFYYYIEGEYLCSWTGCFVFGVPNTWSLIIPWVRNYRVGFMIIHLNLWFCVPPLYSVVWPLGCQEQTKGIIESCFPSIRGLIKTFDIWGSFYSPFSQNEQSVHVIFYSRYLIMKHVILLLI